MDFHSSYIGMYFFQSILHTAITWYLVEISLRIWNLTDPKDKFLYRISVFFFPIVLFPTFQYFNPHRSSFYFTQDKAFFDSTAWSAIKLFGFLSLDFLVLLILFVTAIMTFFQEVWPLIQKLYLSIHHKKKETTLENTDQALNALNTLKDLYQQFGIKSLPRLKIVNQPTPMASTTGILKPVIILSDGLLNQMDTQQIRCVLAHELAHIVRRSNLSFLILFILRMILFFNPVSLIMFRKVIQDEEHACDDLSISMIRDPSCLALTLTQILTPQKTFATDLLIEDRITRLKNQRPFHQKGFAVMRYVMTMCSIIFLNYFIV